MATPVESERKSWSLTKQGERSQREPGFLKLPTSSRFLVSTLMMGRPRRWKRCRRSPRPLQPGDGIAGRVVFEQELDQRDDVGGFFSTGLRPPPERRVRPFDTF